MKFHERKVIVKDEGNMLRAFEIDFEKMIIISRGCGYKIRVSEDALQYKTNSLVIHWVTLHPVFQDAYQGYLVDSIMLGEDNEDSI